MKCKHYNYEPQCDSHKCDIHNFFCAFAIASYSRKDQTWKWAKECCKDYVADNLVKPCQYFNIQRHTCNVTWGSPCIFEGVNNNNYPKWYFGAVFCKHYEATKS